MDECEACNSEKDGYESGWHSCGVYVGCDDDCRALVSPVTREDKDKALEHWKYHGYLSGCSHGS